MKLSKKNIGNGFLTYRMFCNSVCADASQAPQVP